VPFSCGRLALSVTRRIRNCNSSGFAESAACTAIRQPTRTPAAAQFDGLGYNRSDGLFMRGKPEPRTDPPWTPTGAYKCRRPPATACWVLGGVFLSKWGHVYRCGGANALQLLNLTDPAAPGLMIMLSAAVEPSDIGL